MTPTQLGTLAVVTIAAGAGPAALWLVRTTQHSPRPWRPIAQTALVTSVGLLAAAITILDRGYGLLVLVVLGGAAAAVDLVERRLPNLLTTGLALGTAAIVSADALLTATSDRAARAAVTAAAALGATVAVKLARTAMIGWGDVKFTVGVAGLLGWWSASTVFTALVVGSVLIAATTVLVAVSPTVRRRDVPYGPALWLGALAAFFAAG